MPMLWLTVPHPFNVTNCTKWIMKEEREGGGEDKDDKEDEERGASIQGG